MRKISIPLFLLSLNLLAVEPSAFKMLPPGAVKPERWLRHQLELQAKGLTGNAEKLYDDIGQSTWLTHKKSSDPQYDWERGPYYARGLLLLAYELDDELLKKKAQSWVDAIFGWQHENGDIGPRKENWWANMLALCIVRDWHMITGEKRCLDYVEKYAKFQLKALRESPLMKDFGDRAGSPPWAAARGGDELQVLLYCYDIDERPVFLEAAALIASQTAPWTDYYHFGAPNWAYQEHIVNFNQGLKTPALLWRLGIGDAALNRSAYAAAVSDSGWVKRVAGRPDAMQNGEEPLRDRETTGGTELCAEAERIVSCADQIEVLADAKAADDMELVAYNCLPATLNPDCTALRYYMPLNAAKCTNERLDYCHNANGEWSIVPGPHAGFGCCRSNFHIAWPKFVQSMWMRFGEGFAAVAYGPCRLETEQVTIAMDTDYPFRNKVVIKIEKGGGKFPILVRIPGWAKEKDAGTFRRYFREWKPGDEIVLDFTVPPSVEKGWNRNSAVVRRGALIFSWPVPHDKRLARDWGDGFRTEELFAAAPFNVALDLSSGAAIKVFDAGCRISGQPFDVASAPVRLKIGGFRTDACGWGRFRIDAPALMNEPPPSPLAAMGQPEELELIPLGCTQTRITLFPWK